LLSIPDASHQRAIPKCGPHTAVTPHKAAINPSSPITPAAAAPPGTRVGTDPPAVEVEVDPPTADVNELNPLEARLATLDPPVTATLKTDVAPLITSVVSTLEAALTTLDPPLTATLKTEVAPLL